MKVADAGGRYRNMGNVISLREIEEGDLPIFLAHEQDPIANQVAEFLPREHEAFMVHWKKILANSNITKRTILIGARVAGNVVCFEQSKRYFIGYWIGREFWGRGIASQAVAQFLELTKARPLYAYVAKRNTASIRVLEKSGFEACQDTQGISDSKRKESESDESLFVHL